MPDTSPRDRADAARDAARTAARKLALDAGSPIVSRPLYPGAGTATRDVEPAAGLRAARDLEQAALRLARDYIRQAREAGLTWHDIGTTLRLTPDRRTGTTTAQAAFDYATDPDSRWSRTDGPSATWTCTSCTSTITDRGLDNTPADNERGHAPGCPRLQATIDALNAEWEPGQ